VQYRILCERVGYEGIKSSRAESTSVALKGLCVLQISIRKLFVEASNKKS